MNLSLASRRILKQRSHFLGVGSRRRSLTTTTAATTAAAVSSDEHHHHDVISKYWKYNAETQRHQRPIFVAATKQHVGKTTVSLALVSGLQKRFNKVGFIKPVGQQHVNVHSDNLDETIRVDKDVCLVRERFQLNHLDYQHMSPVIIPRGYTKKFVKGEISYQQQLNDIETSFAQISASSDVVVVEGTGHCAVGSIVNVNNAKVASMVGADMVLVANGGLGSAFDELELNRVLCQHYHVRVAGVILNKVMPDKLEQTKEIMSMALKDRWGIPLLACIPDRPFLGCPALADLERLFNCNLMSGQEHSFRHYNISNINVVTTSLSRFLENLREKPSRTLYICHVTRDDIILGFLGEYQRRMNMNKGKEDPPFEAALLICGRKEKYTVSNELKDMIVGSQTDAPIMVCGDPTNVAVQKIHQFTPKLNIQDTNRVSIAVEHYEPYIDFEELSRRTTSQDSSFNDPASLSFDELRKM